MSSPGQRGDLLLASPVALARLAAPFPSASEGGRIASANASSAGGGRLGESAEVVREPAPLTPASLSG
ncbi:MAG: hypothetical protein ACRDK7_06750 [Solirubrobacteraceae bacterium]